MRLDGSLVSLNTGSIENALQSLVFRFFYYLEESYDKIISQGQSFKYLNIRQRKFFISDYTIEKVACMRQLSIFPFDSKLVIYIVATYTFPEIAAE